MTESVKLPEPRYYSNVSIEQGLRERRSVRHYQPVPLTLAEVSQLLWAAQGGTGPGGYRTAPSAGALYPLEVTLAVGNVDDLRVGLYRYDIRSHELIKTAEGDKREALCRASLGQSCVRDGALVLAFSAFYDRVTNYYGERGIRYVFMEVGHAAQNVHLQAISLSIGTVVIGAFRDPKVKRLLHLHDREEPLYLMPLGKLPPQGR